MLINETSKITNLTKKAIEYYIERELIFPDLLDNGYRDFLKLPMRNYMPAIQSFRKYFLIFEGFFLFPESNKCKR